MIAELNVYLKSIVVTKCKTYLYLQVSNGVRLKGNLSDSESVSGLFDEIIKIINANKMYPIKYFTSFMF